MRDYGTEGQRFESSRARSKASRWRPFSFLGESSAPISPGLFLPRWTTKLLSNSATGPLRDLRADLPARRLSSPGVRLCGSADGRCCSRTAPTSRSNPQHTPARGNCLDHASSSMSYACRERAVAVAPVVRCRREVGRLSGGRAACAAASCSERSRRRGIAVPDRRGARILSQVCSAAGRSRCWDEQGA